MNGPFPYDPTGENNLLCEEIVTQTPNFLLCWTLPRATVFPYVYQPLTWDYGNFFLL